MEISKIQEIVFTYLNQLKFDQQDLDYSRVQKHTETLHTLSQLSQSGAQIFDLNKKQILFFSPNLGKALGYDTADFEDLNYAFFASKIHPEEQHQLALNGLTTLKMFHAFSLEEKLNHKVIHEYQMLNAQNQYVRLIEHYRVLELDKKGQIWLMISLVDISPNQETNSGVKTQMLNFTTGNIIPLETEQQPQLELTKRELEILKMVKQGYLSKEISNKLAISVHTVNTHRYRFLEKLGANNSIEAVMFASKNGLLD